MEIFSAIQTLINRAIEANLINEVDEIYARNQVMEILCLKTFPPEVKPDKSHSIPVILEHLSEYALKEKLFDERYVNKDILESKIMNVLTPRPSTINEVFYRKYKRDPSAATAYFYEISKCSNYIQMKSIAKNINYSIDTQFGELDITINLSKPEKDPKQIALERMQKKMAVEYPKCLLCRENEGYAGRIGYPARSNHRMIRLELMEEQWFLQYSPYLYYNEHSIIISKDHRDMKINHATFQRLLEFIEKYPHYFIGSNADLPIVGGSILSHDHYQGGSYEFAMAKAADEIVFRIEGFGEIDASTIKWPMSVIRLRSKNRNELAMAADHILSRWKVYSDEEAGIHAYSGETRHNTITPIARLKNERFQLDLVLRNNRTDEEHPMGIFHPHEDVHHIKKENIGLIEVMGLAVLPARLKSELEGIEAYLLGRNDLVKDYHQSWADELKERYNSQLTDQNVTDILRKEVGMKFLKALMDAGVFKRTEEGQQAFLRFIQSL
ncbi:UDP-glucose--hexose-1-phosphate uridylyltransferase [Bacillus sp. JJ1122]|uniref:UDP-glucose--hexose-1-phosphate uridylyltransferase n=1 Tax=Bacillus sp. JJ1122 TaxID=3122951 RepID=UPI0030004325